MRVYFLKLTSQDMPADTSMTIWTSSSVVDLYANDIYTNFSTVKSTYGSDFLTNNVWAGLDATAIAWTQQNGNGPIISGTTDAGYITDNRFVDTTGPINIISYWVDQETSGFQQAPVAALTVYNSSDPSSIFPDEWAFVSDITQPGSGSILWNDVHRYSMFKLVFDEKPPLDWELFVRVEIGEPIMAPMYQETRKMLDTFPKWMAVRELDNIVTGATPTTPQSIGGQLINALAGEWLDDIKRTVPYLGQQLYSPSVDLTQKAWVWKTADVFQYLTRVVGDGIEVGRAVDLIELYRSRPDEDVFWWDEQNLQIYCNKHYGTLNIYGDSVLAHDETTEGGVWVQSPHPVWNYIDEMGLLVDLSRLKLEANDSFLTRILDVYINRNGVSKEQFQLALRRELNLWKYYGATPDSAFAGATPTVLELPDIEADPDFFTADGLPTERMVSLVNSLVDIYPTTWGHFRYDKALWDVSGPKYEGFKLLPSEYDASSVDVAEQQSGIGDGNDLYVYGPDVITGPHEFEARLRARGRIKSTVYTTPPVQLQAKIYGTGSRHYYNNPTINPYLSFEIETFFEESGGATPTFLTFAASIQLPATSNADVDKTSGDDSGNTAFNLFISDDATNPVLVFYDMSTGLLFPQRIPAGNIKSVTLKSGYWDPQSKTYTLQTNTDIFQAWFSSNSAAVLTYNSGSPSLLGVDGTPGALPRAKLILHSTSIVFTTAAWNSPMVTYDIDINNTPLNTGTAPFVMATPSITWDSYLLNSPTPTIVVAIVTNNGAATPTYGGNTVDANGSPVFIPSPYIALNASASWTGGNTQVIDQSTTTLTFSMGSGGLYPVPTTEWTAFEAAQQRNFFTGIVDQNGPWQNGVSPIVGNTNFVFDTAVLSRADFGLPDNANYFVNWIGIESVDEDFQLVLWLNTNVVQPANAEPYYLQVYPANAIVETIQGGHYTFGAIPLMARLRPTASPQWYPQINSGWFYEKGTEYYLYANPRTDVATPHIPDATPYQVALSNLNRQGAPIIVKTVEVSPREFREVCFFAPEASPTLQTLTNVEFIKGNGSSNLYLSYEDVYNVTVIDLTPIPAVPVITTPISALTNVIPLPITTDPTHTYQVDYIVNLSFFVDNLYEGSDGKQHSLLTFDQSPTQLGVSDYDVTFETSLLNPATPVSIPLNPMFTTFSQGFLFISHDEYTLETLEIRVNPGTLIADGQDYLILSLLSLDSYNNPKGYQVFTLATSFGTLESVQLTTNRDGFASTRLVAGTSHANPTGTITVTGPVAGTGFFGIIDPTVRGFSLVAVANPEMVPSDGASSTVVVGRVDDSSFGSVPQAVVSWVLGRSVHDVLNPSSPYSPVTQGSITADAGGKFVLGPFVSNPPTPPSGGVTTGVAPGTGPGYWFMALSSTGSASATPITYPLIGDMVFWYEYPTGSSGVEPISGLPPAAIQMATPPILYPYGSVIAYPVSVSETPATPPPATPKQPTYTPPSWYGVPPYVQQNVGWTQPGWAWHSHPLILNTPLFLQLLNSTAKANYIPIVPISDPTTVHNVSNPFWKPV